MTSIDRDLTVAGTGKSIKKDERRANSFWAGFKTGRFKVQILA